MKTHPLNVSYLVLGLAFLGIAGSWVLHQQGVIGSNVVEWLLPLTLVVAGAVGLVAFMVRGLGGRRTDQRPDTYDQSHDDDTTLIFDEGENR
jgi:cytochrome c-type biogenesis protein CcmH/NrfF